MQTAGHAAKGLLLASGSANGAGCGCAKSLHRGARGRADQGRAGPAGETTSGDKGGRDGGYLPIRQVGGRERIGVRRTVRRQSRFRRPAEGEASALEEGVWGRNLLKVSPQLAQLHQTLVLPPVHAAEPVPQEERLRAESGIVAVRLLAPRADPAPRPRGRSSRLSLFARGKRFV